MARPSSRRAPLQRAQAAFTLAKIDALSETLSLSPPVSLSHSLSLSLSLAHSRQCIARRSRDRLKSWLVTQMAFLVSRPCHAFLRAPPLSPRFPFPLLSLWFHFLSMERRVQIVSVDFSENFLLLLFLFAIARRNIKQNSAVAE